jgi:hypothetical protein
MHAMLPANKLAPEPICFPTLHRKDNLEATLNVVVP